MISKKVGKNYLVNREDGGLSVKIDRKKADTSLTELYLAFKKIDDVLDSLMHTDYDLYDLISQEIFEKADLSVDDGHCWNIRYMRDLTDEAIDILKTHNDNVKTKEDMMSLVDYGYRNYEADNKIWTKVLIDNNEEEVVEEIFKHEGKYIRRKRRIEWEILPGIKSSKTITYTNLRFNKNLLKAAKNTFEGNVRNGEYVDDLESELDE